MLEGEKLRQALREDTERGAVKLEPQNLGGAAICPFCEQPVESENHAHVVTIVESEDGSITQSTQCAHVLCTLLGALGFIPTPEGM